MKIRYVSDLHLESCYFTWKESDADVNVLAGDITTIACMHLFDALLKKVTTKPTYYVFGNHEFYRTDMAQMKALIKKYEETYPNFHVLDNTWHEFDGVLFAGSTLWTNFSLLGDQERCKYYAKHGVTDFHVIAKNGRIFTPDDAEQEYLDACAFYTLAKQQNKKTVFISHFVPSPRSIAERWRGSSLNSYFTTDSEWLAGDNVVAWIHGHTHDSCDHYVRGTHVVCNPRGYTKTENREFSSTKYIEV